MVRSEPAAPSERLALLSESLTPPASSDPTLIRRCSEHLQQLDAAQQRSFRDPMAAPIQQLVQQRAEHVADIIRLLWRDAVQQHAGTAGAHMALVAAGGFGRMELHPYSDIDLLILDADGTDAEPALIEHFISQCWDAGLAVSHSVRNIEQTLAQCHRDVVTVTSLMEARFLCGDQARYAQLQQNLQQTLDRHWPPQRFFTAKMAEQERRHASFDDTAYRLEPNIKDGPGGLRDIQNIAWVCQRCFGSAELQTLVAQRFLNANEYQQLLDGRDFLWRVRWANHQLAGRAEERLLFAQQKQLAALFGQQTDANANVAVERFMQAYYRTVTQLERLNERLLQQLRESFSDSAGQSVYALDDEFQVINGYLEVQHDGVLLQRPLAIMELFLKLQDQPNIKGVRATSIRLLQQALAQHGDELRHSQAALQVFWRILNHPNGVYSQLSRMARYGLLADLLPAFGKVSGLMQFDLFHVYTVDQHTLFVIRNLRRFAHRKHADQFGHAIEVFARVERPVLLYLAGLFHDIAKGQGGDHSELGAANVAEFAARLPLPPEDVELLSWLVRQHLLMSRVAQHSDISDPEVIQQFAREVGSRRRLDYLYLLTVADIAATNPGLWNSWKDSLLWNLLEATSNALQRGLQRPLPRSLVVRETRGLLFSELIGQGYAAEQVSAFIARMPRHSFLRLDNDELHWVAECLLHDSKPDAATQDTATRPPPLLRLRTLVAENVTALLVIAPSFDGFFATVMSVMDRMRLNIYHARILHTQDAQPLAVDLFQLVGADGLPLSASDGQRLQQKLAHSLQRQEIPTRIDYAVPRRLREFISDAEIVFTAARQDREIHPFEMHLHEQLTVMEISCTDRPGLLSLIALCLLQQGIRLHDARIATYGEQVRDIFLLSDYSDKPLSTQARSELRTALLQSLSGDQD
ncbi:MAG: [protein-PII] uridylyltransferase [Wenzhouxiangellaceae bacterium]